MRFRVTLDSTFDPIPADILQDEQALALIEEILEHLNDEGAIDPDAGGALTQGVVRISVTIDAQNPADALHHAEKQIRSAVEQAGAMVEDWATERFIVEPEENVGHLLLATN